MIKIKINKQWCFLENIDKEQLKEIDKHLSYKVNGYFFSPLYRMGRWDGLAHLFNRKKQSFRTGFLYRIIQLFELNKWKFEVIDNREIKENIKYDYLNSLIDKPVYGDRYFRDVQFQAIYGYLNKGFYGTHLHRGIISMPPRSGKTTVAGVLIKILNKYPALFIVHKIDLALQTKDEFEKIFKTNIGIIGDGNCNVNSKIVVTTIQSIRSAYNIKDKDDEFDTTERKLNEKDYDKVKEFIGNSRVCIVDECHISSSQTFQELPLILSNNEDIIGLSGTPYRDDNTDYLIEQLCGPIIYDLTKKEAVEKGYILPVISYFIKLPEIEVPDNVYQTQKKHGLNENTHVLTAVKKIIGILYKKKLSSVIIVRERAQGNLIQKLLNCEYLHGGIKGEKRKEIYKKLNDKKILTIVSTVTDVGVDIPTLDCVIMASPTKSKVASFQRIRCNTAIKDKKYGRVFVICPQIKLKDNDEKDYLSNHWRKMRTYYNQEPIITVKEMKLEEL